MMGVMISTDSSGALKVTFPYDPVYVARIKSIPGRKWHPDGKYWTFPYSKMVFDQIQSAFAREDLDIDESLKSLVPQTQVERPIATAVLDRFRDLMRLKHYSTRTEETYLHWITRYLAFHNDRDPKEMGSEEIEAFLSHLAVDLKVAAGTQNGAFNAILFLYRDVLRKELPEPINAIRAKKPQRLPTVMSKDEVLKVVAAVPPEHQLMVKLIYGSGLRLMECLRASGKGC